MSTELIKRPEVAKWLKSWEKTLPGVCYVQERA